MSLGLLSAITTIDIITANISISKRKKTIRKFERFSLQANINNKQSHLGIAYRF